MADTADPGVGLADDPVRNKALAFAPKECRPRMAWVLNPAMPIAIGATAP